MKIITNGICLTANAIVKFIIHIKSNICAYLFTLIKKAIFLSFKKCSIYRVYKLYRELIISSLKLK